MPQYQSKNDLKSNAKAVSIGVLNARLADAIDLALLTKQAHWNIKGPNFIALHEMIDGFRTEIDEHVDTMAERVGPRTRLIWCAVPSGVARLSCHQLEICASSSRP